MNRKKKTMLGRDTLSDVLIQKEDLVEEASDHIAFFLGAGASIKAGVPDTFSFVADFIGSLKKELKEQVEQIVNIIEEWGQKQNPPKKVDIELLLEALQTLSNKEQEILIPFINNPQLKLSNIDPAALLMLLRNFIKNKVIVDIENIKYMEPLRAFIQEYNPLDVYSANYDTCVELFCSEHKLHYKDGFDEEWNAKVFDDENVDIRLFKIHGSIMWYQSERSRFIKIPLRTNDNTVELITKERANGLMLYPAQKFEYVEPLFELLMEMKKRLARCKILFVIGYSFRDDHVRRIFWDIARKNREFRIVLIGPDSWKIYQDRLKYYENRKTKSSLTGKIVCLPYKFESVLPVLKTDFLRDIRFSNALINEQKANEIAGQRTQWQDCLVSTASSGDIEELKPIYDKININDIERRDYENAFACLLQALFYAIASRDKIMVAYYWAKFKEIILLYPSRLEINIVTATSFINITLNASTSIAPRDIYEILNKFIGLMKVRMLWLNDVTIMNRYLDMLREIQEMISIWYSYSVSYDEYLSARKANSSALKGHLDDLRKNVQGAPDSLLKIVKEAAIETEIEEINTIVNKYDIYFKQGT